MEEFRFHSALTYSVSHKSIMHLGFNMLTFYFFGRTVEAHFGPKRLLSLYLAGALAGAFMHLYSSGNGYKIGLGASAAVNALLTYYICNFPREIIILFVLPVPAWVVGMILLGQSWYGYGGNSNIGHEAHLGGILAGVGYYMVTRGRI